MSTLQIATLAAGYLLAALRLANALRPLWAWLPASVQLALPPLLVAIGQAADLLEGEPTAESLVRAAALVVVAGLVAWRGNPPAPPASRGLGLTPLALLLVACGGSGEPPKWPTPGELLACAPPAPALLDAAQRALLTADPEARRAALEDLAVEHGPALLACALSRLAAANGLPGVMTAASSPAPSVAAARARAFLVDAGSLDPAAAPAAGPPSSPGSPGAAGGNSTP